MGVRLAWVLGVALALCAGVARAGDEVVEISMSPGVSPGVSKGVQGGAADRPVLSGRVVTRFDFDERAANPEEVPANWFRAQHNPPERERMGFPAFNRARFDHTQGAGSSGSSVVLPTRGGSTALRLAAGSLVVFADAEYRVSAMVKTKGLVNARAVVRATLLDGQREVLAGSMVQTEPVVSEGGWVPVGLTVPSGRAGANFLQIELLLLQPGELGVGHDGGGREWSQVQDLEGSAWFDDVTIVQLPRVVLTSNRLANTFFAPDAPAVIVDVRDLTGAELATELVVSDLDDKEVWRLAMTIPRGGSKTRVPLSLPGFGWFRVRMELGGLRTLAGGGLAGVKFLTETTVVWVPSSGGGDGVDGEGGVSLLRPFALFAEGVGTGSLAGLPALASGLGVPRLTVGLPTEYSANAPTPAVALGEMLDNLSANRVELTVSLPAMPRPVAEKLRLSRSNVWGLGGVESGLWLGEIEGLIGSSGQRLASWQFGPTLGPAPLDHDLIPAQVRGLSRAFSRATPGLRVMLPWRADSEWLGSGGGARAFSGASIVVPAGYPISSLRGMLENFARVPADGVDTTYVVEALPGEQFSKRDQLEHFLQRAVVLWSELSVAKRAGPLVRVGAADPWRVGVDGQLKPEPILAVLSTLSAATAGMRVIAEVPSDAAIRTIVLAPESGSPVKGGLRAGPGGGNGTIILWCEGKGGQPQDSGRTITGFFGGGELTLIDAFGNRKRLLPENNSGQHVIPVSTTPAYVLGIDPHLVQFLSQIQVQPELIPAVVTSHDCELVLHNPWPSRISGDITLHNPPTRSARDDQNWVLSPTAPIPFSIAPGQTVRLPFVFQFTAAEEAGVKQLPMSVRLSVDRPYPAMRVTKPISVGLEDLELQLATQLGPRDDGPDVILTGSVSNIGKLTRTLQLWTSASGFATQSQPVVDLGPGETAVRQFVFKNAAEALTGRRLRVILVDVDGAERMSKYVMVP
jgi:hypothetical protein